MGAFFVSNYPQSTVQNEVNENEVRTKFVCTFVLMEILKVKDVSKRLDISERAVQLRCKMYKVPKVKGRYQLTEDIVQRWQNEAVNERTKLANEAKRSALSEPESTSNQLDLEDVIQEVETEYPKGSEILLPNEVEAMRQRLQNEKLLEVEVRLLRERLEDFQNQVNYLRTSLDKQNNQFQKLIDSIQQRNFIEAKDKGLDTP